MSMPTSSPSTRMMQASPCFEVVTVTSPAPMAANTVFRYTTAASSFACWASVMGASCAASSAGASSFTGAGSALGASGFFSGALGASFFASAFTGWGAGFSSTAGASASSAVAFTLAGVDLNSLRVGISRISMLTSSRGRPSSRQAFSVASSTVLPVTITSRMILPPRSFHSGAWCARPYTARRRWRGPARCAGGSSRLR